MRLLMILSLCLSLPFVAGAQTTDQPGGVISIQSDMAQDTAITNRIRDILRQLDGYGDVNVTVADGIVTLSGTTFEAAKVTALSGLVSRVEGVVAIENTVTETTDVAERLNPAVARIQARLAQAAAFVPLMFLAALAALLVFLLGLFLARLERPWDSIAPNAFIADIYRQIIRLVFAIGGVVLALDLLNATALLGTILGAAGIAGLAFGFAVRDTVENFIASIMLSMRQPFRPKDLVEIEGDMGHVIRLTSRATILLSLDGNQIRIPNSTVFKSRIVNYSRNDETRFTFTLCVDMNADIADAQRIIVDALQELPFTLDNPGPAAWVDSIGASSIAIIGAGWVMQHETSLIMAKGEAIRIAKARLEEAGITLPEPTYRLITNTTSARTADRVGQTAKTPTKGAPAKLQDIHSQDTQALTQIVEAERDAPENEDLLTPRAPQE